jgi:hypothetical protein
MEENEIQKNIKTLISSLDDKWRGRTCPMCGIGKWSVQGSVFELREFHGGGLFVGSGPIIPVVPITCVNCGNTILINAISSGIIQSEKNKEGQK